MSTLIYLNDNILIKIVYGVFWITGKNVIAFVSAIGRFSIFLKKTVFAFFTGKFFLKVFFNSLFVNGFCSIPVICLTGLFTGSVLALQLFLSLKTFGVESTVPYIVLLALTKELAPVLCALMMVSRVGSSMSAEIGSMATNNQIDILTTMSINKYRFLYIPRIVSIVVAQPILTTIAVISGVIGSFIISTTMFDFADISFYNLVYEGFEPIAYLMCVIKSCVFGLIISTIACYKGNKTKDGAVGIKNTTISTVVLCCVYILIMNFLITWLMS